VRKYAVESRLSDRDFKAFCGVIRGRRNTIDMAHAWLSKRGYDISRGAVWKFSKALRERRTGLDTLTAEGRLACRRRIVRCCDRLRSRDLAVAAALLESMVDLNGQHRKSMNATMRRRDR
jgi:hypothetical protein